MPKFHLPAEWKVSGFHIIEARNIEQARKIANDPDKMEELGLDVLPPPWQELTNDDYTESPEDLRRATRQEIAQAERGQKEFDTRAARDEALRETLEALRGLLGMVENVLTDSQLDAPQMGGTRALCADTIRAAINPAAAAITKAEKALGEA